MKPRPSTLLLSAMLALAACAEAPVGTSSLYRAPSLSSTVDGVVWEAGNWAPFLPAGEEGTSWGNHRAVVEVDSLIVQAGGTVEAVTVTVPWRRHDPDPGAKSVVVLDAATNQPVANALAVRFENASGDVVFQPNPSSTVYHLYYMPWASSGGYYPTVTYPAVAPSPDPAWAARVTAAGAGALPRAVATRIQSVDEFHSFFPMEVIATPDEEAAFMAGAPQGWRAVPEHRDRPVRMKHFLPRHWAVADAPDSFASEVLKDENFTFQVALIPGDESLDDVRVSFDGFPAGWAEAWTCFNCGGVDENGQVFEKVLHVPAGTVQPLWLGIRVPAGQNAGPVDGTVTVSTAHRGSRSIAVSLDVQAATAVNHGEDEPDLMTRLAWLNSRVGEDADAVLAPFKPVEVDGRTLSILGRRVELGAAGLPSAMESFFTPELTGFSDEAQPILAAPLELQVTVGGAPETFRPGDVTFRRTTAGRAEWTATSVSDRFTLGIEGALEYDGMLDVRMTLVAGADVEVDDVALPVHYATGAADYMLGLGRMGGRRPASLSWKWAVENHQEGVWLGGINRGLQYVLRDENYVRPLNTNFYRNQPLEMPPSWFNQGRGGITLAEVDGAAVARNYSGPRSLQAGDTLHFNVRFLITPFKPIDTRAHFDTRFVHQYVPVDSVAAWGGTVVNIHHANEINPYINYPFFNLEAQSAYIEEAHARGIKVKLYDTIRELTYKAHELFALRSLGDEILNDGEGGGHSWMQEHLEDGYHSAWHAWRVDDAAMLDKGTSRWTNYYVEGLGWLARNQHIDGLYLDDIAFSRATVKRMVNVLQQSRDEVVIDLHSANQFNVRDGFINSAMLYMEHFPYISRLWFGEYFDYGQDPDYWMTEVSGLPFGLMGEMLQDGGHPYRGMLYGMTARKYGEVDPRPVWAMMNDFGIAESRMLGYWLEDAPVRTGNDRILATAYAADGKALIALASWSDRDEVVSLDLDWGALGLGSTSSAAAPAVAGLQEGGVVDLAAIRVPAGQGSWVVVVG
ncbi:MAG TPA: glycoside hydrolase domain-containing protein [Longimicrobiales bacterium]|nr:glycoside hydrolase domain-containing protein [Longimicrobiales bacterium]